MKSLFHWMLPECRKSIAFGKAPRIRPCVLARTTCWWWWWVRCADGQKLTGGNRSIRRISCAHATVFTTNLNPNELGSKAGRRGEKSATNRLRYGTVWRSSTWNLRFQILPHSKHTESPLQRQSCLHIEKQSPRIMEITRNMQLYCVDEVKNIVCYSKWVVWIVSIVL
jgi:hypothetical protein